MFEKYEILPLLATYFIADCRKESSSTFCSVPKILCILQMFLQSVMQYNAKLKLTYHEAFSAYKIEN